MSMFSEELNSGGSTSSADVTGRWKEHQNKIKAIKAFRFQPLKLKLVLSVLLDAMLLDAMLFDGMLLDITLVKFLLSAE